jgi:hypothetical protein
MVATPPVIIPRRGDDRLPGEHTGEQSGERYARVHCAPGGLPPLEALLNVWEDNGVITKAEVQEEIKQLREKSVKAR